MLLLLSVILVACGGNDKDEGSKDDASDNGEKPEFLSLLTGGTSGTYYPLGGGIAKVITDEVGISTDALSSRSEEHTSELQSRGHLVCRLLLEKKKTHGISRAVVVDSAAGLWRGGIRVWTV